MVGRIAAFLTLPAQGYALSSAVSVSLPRLAKTHGPGWGHDNPAITDALPNPRGSDPVAHIHTMTSEKAPTAPGGADPALPR